jgi:hypothetical protein
MAFLVSLIPFFMMICLHSAITKAAGRIFRKTRISWLVCFIYTFVIIFQSGIIKILFTILGITFNFPLAILLNVIAQRLFGAWFFSKWARTEEGNLLNPIAAAKLTGVILLFFCILLIGLLGLYSAISSFLPAQ